MFSKISLCAGSCVRLQALYPSNGFHSSSFPGLLAWLAHADPEQVPLGLKAFESHALAVEWCEHGCDESVAMARRSMLKSALMDWAVRHCKEAGFKTVTDLFGIFLREMYEGGLQTVINERMNQAIRDTQERSTPSKFASRMKRWDVAAHSGWVEHWGRENVDTVHSEASFGSSVDLTTVFEPPQ